MIELDKISKTFNAGKPNAFSALKEIDLKIAQNRVTAFVGPSGSGKTTLLSIIGCMTRPSAGRICLNGRETTSLPERFASEIRRTTFGFIFQNYNLIRGITVLENVMIPAYPVGIKRRLILQKARDLLDKLDIAEKAAQKVELLSGGEQQRTAIARALINEPAVIIADEPTAHLDTDMAGTFMDIVSGLKKDGKTVLIASHDPVVFQSTVVDHIVAFRDGAIVRREERS